MKPMACEIPRVRDVRAPYMKGQPTTGTRKGFKLHLQAGEIPCAACRAAKDASYEQQRVRRAEAKKARAEAILAAHEQTAFQQRTDDAIARLRYLGISD